MAANHLITQGFKFLQRDLQNLYFATVAALVIFLVNLITIECAVLLKRLKLRPFQLFF